MKIKNKRNKPDKSRERELLINLPMCLVNEVKYNPLFIVGLKDFGERPLFMFANHSKALPCSQWMICVGSFTIIYDSVSYISAMEAR